FALRRLKEVEIVEAQDGMDGLRKVSSDHFDLALIDINMPVMDGLKLISLIRGDEALKEIPIVVITTEGANEDRRRALELGANEPEADWGVTARVRPLKVEPPSLSPVVLTLEYQVHLELDLHARARDGREVKIDPRELSESERYLSSADAEAQRKNRDEAL